MTYQDKPYNKTITVGELVGLLNQCNQGDEVILEGCDCDNSAGGIEIVGEWDGKKYTGATYVHILHIVNYELPKDYLVPGADVKTEMERVRKMIAENK
jgi:hypothetical protein